MKSLDIASGARGDRPMARAATVAGIRVQLVNWYDYQGWEVRIADMPSGQTAKLLGHLHKVYGDDEVGLWTARSQRGARVRAQFTSPKDAIRWLLEVAS